LVVVAASFVSGPVERAAAYTEVHTGTLDASDPSMAVVSINGTTDTCGTQGATLVHYDVIPFTPLTTGAHTFSLSSDLVPATTFEFASLYLYEGSFDPTNATVNCVAADNDADPPTGDKIVTYTPTVGTPYFVVVFDDTFVQVGGSYELTIDAPPIADLGVSITSAGGAHVPGADVPFTVTVTNAGPDDAASPTVTVTLPPQFDPGTVTGLTANAIYACTVGGGGTVITCTAPAHPIGQPATVTFAARLTFEGPGFGVPAVVTAAVASATPDLNTANDTSSTTVVPPTFVTTAPVRLADTRSIGGIPGAGSVLSIPVIARPEVPQGATSVLVNLTATQVQAAGFFTLYACSMPRPNTSNANFQPGADTANFTMSTVGLDGNICLYTSASTHLIVDLVGYTTPAFTPAAPQRLADTRTGATPAAGSTVRVTLPAGSGHVVNVTSTRGGAAGFLTAWDCDAAQPATSNLNFAAGADVANLAVATADGQLCVFTSSPTDILVDHLGALGGTTSSLARLVDTRTTAAATPGTRIAIGALSTAHPTAIINLTATQTATAGYLTVHACSDPLPNTSNLNVTPGRDIANLAIVPTDRPMCVTVQANTHVLIDLLSTVT
jgi:uncharacterized repeat protein (TIGR01451 family)